MRRRRHRHEADAAALRNPSRMRKGSDNQIRTHCRQSPDTGANHGGSCRRRRQAITHNADAQIAEIRIVYIVADGQHDPTEKLTSA
jgi:hypothetical protein